MKERFIIAGPCVVESFGMLDETASLLSGLCRKFGLKYYFKSSYKKANRTSAGSFTGIGDEKALKYLAEIGEKYNVPVLTDIHSVKEAEMAAEYAAALQIPAFLSRQTELLQAAGKTGKIINIKKAQFMSSEAAIKAAEKVKETGNDKIWLTERGTFFGYGDLVVDFRNIALMRQSGYPVVYDATHSVQKPSAWEQSGGAPEFTESLAKAAVAAGIDGLFFETHPDPSQAKSDSAVQLPLKNVEKFLESVLKHWDV